MPCFDWRNSASHFCAIINNLKYRAPPLWSYLRVSLEPQSTRFGYVGLNVIHLVQMIWSNELIGPNDLELIKFSHNTAARYRTWFRRPKVYVIVIH